MYSEKVMDHFMSPQNAGSMLAPDAEGNVGDTSCGDALTMFIRVQNNCIQDISYLVFGCCASIATSSKTSVLAKGKTLEEALKISEEEIINALDGLPESKVHGSNLGVSTLRKVINNYYEKINKMEEII